MTTPDKRDKAEEESAPASLVDRLRARGGRRKRESLLVAFAQHVEETGEAYPNWPEELQEDAVDRTDPDGASAGGEAAAAPLGIPAAPSGQAETGERRGPAEEAAHDGRPDPGPQAPAEPLADGLARALAIAYAEPGQGLGEHRIEVRAIFRRAGQLYLRAYCNLAQAERDFRVDRIVELADLDTGEAPGDPSDFVLGRLLGRNA